MFLCKATDEETSLNKCLRELELPCISCCTDPGREAGALWGTDPAAAAATAEPASGHNTSSGSGWIGGHERRVPGGKPPIRDVMERGRWQRAERGSPHPGCSTGRQSGQLAFSRAGVWTQTGTGMKEEDFLQEGGEMRNPC